MQEFSEIRQNDFIDWINGQWGICFESIKTDADIQGSPERSLSRCVIRDKGGALFLIEKFTKDKLSIRQRVAQSVEYLNDNGLDSALAYLKTTQGDFLPFWGESFIGVSPFLDGTVLQRPDYLQSSPMGESFADFLIQMSSASVGINARVSLEIFSIKKYLYKIFSEMKKFDRLAYDMFLPFLNYLEKAFMDAHDYLPHGFCHGDLHPLNVIWKKDQIRAVIDWEFTGIKPQIFDAANLVGCAGIENPKGLAMPMVTTFIQQIHEEKIYEESGWQFFPEYVLALRFAWLSEWLRKKDNEMIEMEAAFMKILVDNMDILKSGWKLQP